MAGVVWNKHAKCLVLVYVIMFLVLLLDQGQFSWSMKELKNGVRKATIGNGLYMIATLEFVVP